MTLLKHGPDVREDHEILFDDEAGPLVISADVAQLKQIFTPEERALFNRAFLGVMGIDLGGVGVDKSNYPRGFLGPE